MAKRQAEAGAGMLAAPRALATWPKRLTAVAILGRVHPADAAVADSTSRDGVGVRHGRAPGRGRRHR